MKKDWEKELDNKFSHFEVYLITDKGKMRYLNSAQEIKAFIHPLLRQSYEKGRISGIREAILEVATYSKIDDKKTKELRFLNSSKPNEKK